MRKIAIFPTLMTLGNGICGFGAITLAARISRGSFPVDREPVHWLWLSAILILVAMVFDALDGFVARVSKTTSDFGGQLDSLCDAVSFGIAPAFLLLKLSSDHSRFSDHGIWMRCVWLIAALYVVCVILRLARFNVENSHGEDSHLYFKGLPSPAAAGAIASVAILWNELQTPPLPPMLAAISLDPEGVGRFLQIALPLATILVSGLMVSNLHYRHQLNHLIKGKRSFSQLVSIVFVLMLIILLHQLTLPLVFWSFVLASPLMIAWKALRTGHFRKEPAI